MDGDKEFSRKIQQMIKRTIKTTGLRNSVIVDTEELDKSTKYAAMVIDILCSFSYKIVIRYSNPCNEIDSLASLVASACVSLY